MKPICRKIVLCIIVVLLFACSKQFDPLFGVYQGRNENGDKIQIEIVMVEKGNYKISQIGYDFVAGKAANYIYFKNREPFGLLKDNVLYFQFQFAVNHQQTFSFIPSTSLINSRGSVVVNNEIEYAYYSGELRMESQFELSCKLSRIARLDNTYNEQFSSKGIDYSNNAEKGSVMSDSYYFILKLADAP